MYSRVTRLTVLTLVLLTACAEKEAKEEMTHLPAEISDSPDYSGVYRTADAVDCQLQITITPGDDTYLYQLQTTYRKESGPMDVVTDNEHVYFSFEESFGDEPNEVITASFQEATLLIQNYGNSMNQYTRLSECSEKYLELSKQE